MSWSLFVDESGQDQRQSPYEVLAGLAVEDRKIWRLIRELSDAQQHFFGMRLFEAYGKEAKAQKLLNTKVFRLAAQLDPIPHTRCTELAKEILIDGTRASKDRLTALAQAKIAYCCFALDLARRHNAKGFATIVPQSAPRPEQSSSLRKDYAYLFERFYAFLNNMEGDPMGYLVLDELDKSASHILLNQVSSYFVKTKNGRARSRLIIPEPFFVHSDLTTLVQVADIIAYTISWGMRLYGMSEPARAELDPVVSAVQALRFRHQTESRTVWGYTLIKDLRPSEALLA